MTILLIDADSTIPNLALMKLAQHYKDVELLRLDIPYYPNRKKSYHEIDTSKYDKTFCSVIFEGNLECIKGDNIIFGGTGFDLKTNLPDDIENLKPDYSIYPENDISYGFISRGCIRNCCFCKVPKKEGRIRQVSDIDSIVQHKIVKFLDNNFLALPNHKDLLQELITKDIKHQFNQGLDIRLVDTDNSVLLSKLNYAGNYIFALDNVDDIALVKNKLEVMSWHKPWQFKFFTYIHPNMPLKNTIDRIVFLKDNECLPYIMRDISCYGAEYNDFYVDLAAWCNQPGIFKKFDFEGFLKRRHTTKNSQKRIETSLNLWRKNEN